MRYSFFIISKFADICMYIGRQRGRRLILRARAGRTMLAWQIKRGRGGGGEGCEFEYFREEGAF